MKINLTPYERTVVIINKILEGLIWALVMFAVVIVMVALLIIFQEDIQTSLRAAQGVMFG